MYGTLAEKRGHSGGEGAANELASAQNGAAPYKQLNGTANGHLPRNDSQSRWSDAAGDARRKRQIFSHCHMASEESNGDGGTSSESLGVDKSARRRLIVASIICLLFMIGEIVGGVLSGSLAIATDAAHLLTDFASFMISLLAIWLSSRPASRKMSFGWYRAEVIGALLSVLMIWLVTGLLVYMAVERLRTGEFEIDATVMVITASAGLLVNIIMAVALNVDGHGHGHFHSHGSHAHEHEHDIRGHTHLDHVHDNDNENDDDDDDDDDGQLGECASHQKSMGLLNSTTSTTTSGGAPLSLSNGLQADQRELPSRGSKRLAKKCDGERPPKQQQGRGRSNINVRAAFIHVIGDFLQSLGVLIAALVIYFEPSYAIVDPICTFLFSIIVLVTTLNIIKDATNVLMEGIPKGINFIEVREKLQSLAGVVRVHNLRIWSLSLDKIAISTHLVIDTSQVSSAQALKKAIETLKSSYCFLEVTIQIEEFREDMKDCEQCQDEDKDEDNGVVINIENGLQQQQQMDQVTTTAPRSAQNHDGSPA